jgi:hypothetical protein
MNVTGAGFRSKRIRAYCSAIEAAHPCPSPLPVQEVLGGIGHADLLACEASAVRWRPAARGVHSLDERHAVEHARSGRRRSEREPLNRVRVRRASVDDCADCFAAAVGFPCRADVVRADRALPFGVCRRQSIGADKQPARAGPAADLCASRVDVEGERAPGRWCQVAAVAKVRCLAKALRGAVA